jgi:hypothetical protein
MHCLIDADAIIFRCGFAVEHKKHKFFIKGEEHLGPFQIYEYKKEIPKEFKDDPELSYAEESSVEPAQNALHLVKQEMEGIISGSGATSFATYIKGKGNFREEISVTRKYKGNRDVTHRPIHEEAIREYLKKHWNAEEVDGMEVDDKVAIEQSKDYSQYEYEKKCGDNYTECWASTIIASIDKDLDQVPGWHYNFARGEKYWVTEEEAIRSFYMQLLVGDPSDNIQGVNDIGKVTAAKLYLHCVTEMDYYLVAKKAYIECYKEKGIDMLNEMANLLWIRREENQSWIPPL